MTGVLLALSSAVAFGLFQAVNHRANRGVDPLRATFVLLLVSAAFMTAVALLTEDVGALAAAPPAAFAAFVGAGLVHFLLSWTLLTLAQQRLGAARAGALTGTAPLFGALAAYLVLDETVRPIAIVGIALVVVGVPLLNLSRTDRPAAPPTAAPPDPDTVAAPPAERPAAADRTRAGTVGIVLGLGTALCWATSPLLIRVGLRGLPSPVLGVVVGIVAATAAYGLLLLLRRRRLGAELPGRARLWLTVAGVLVGIGTVAQWAAFDLVPVAIVLAIVQLAVPIVLLVSPFIVGRRVEQVTPRLWAAGGTIVAGSVLLVLSRLGG